MFLIIVLPQSFMHATLASLAWRSVHRPRQDTLSSGLAQDAPGPKSHQDMIDSNDNETGTGRHSLQDGTTPVFVVGLQRSGTTWLANQLCENPDIAGVRHHQHHGVHESGYFALIEGRYGDLTTRSNFVEFAETMLASDYFALAGVSQRQLYSLYGSNYAEIFRSIMDDYARRQRSSFWLEKTPSHTKKIHRLAEYFPDAKFVAIIRDPVDAAKSSVARRPEENRGRISRLLLLAKRSHSWAVYNRTIARFSRMAPDRIKVITYDEMTSSKHQTLKSICEFVGAPFSPAMIEDRFKPNTSFDAGSASRSTVISVGDRLFVHSLVKLWKILPFSLLSALRSDAPKHVHRPLPNWFFRENRYPGNDPARIGQSEIQKPGRTCT